MDCRFKITVLLLVILLSSPSFAFNRYNFLIPPSDLYVGLSGGYGQAQQAYQNTGLSSLIRFSFGSLWTIKQKLFLGPEVGFQTGNQIRLKTQAIGEISESGVPIYLNTKTPVDFLLVGKWLFYKPFFVEAKGGYAYISSEATGADIETNNLWLPDLQVGVGMGLTEHSRLILAYQRFFGKKININLLDTEQGIYSLSALPTWQSFLFTIEIKA